MNDQWNILELEKLDDSYNLCSERFSKFKMYKEM